MYVLIIASVTTQRGCTCAFCVYTKYILFKVDKSKETNEKGKKNKKIAYFPIIIWIVTALNWCSTLLDEEKN